MNYSEAEDSWKSNDEWRYADKEAAWKFFFAAGKESSQTVISAQCVKMSQYESIIFELRKQLAAAQEEVERLKAEAEYRYVEQVLSPIRKLVQVARAAWNAADNGLGVLVDNGIELRVSPADFDRLSDALGLLDMLPDDKPGFTLSGPARAEWALRDLIGDTK